MKKYIAEFIGTAVLVLFGTGIAVVSGGNLIATALAFGLAIVAMAYVIGNISGCHVNPAVSLSMLISKKMSTKDFIGYVISQVAGAFAGTGILYAILNGTDIGTAALGANGFDTLSATNITLVGALITEVVLTFVFVYTILGVTSDESKSNVAGIVIGLTLTFVHLLGINLTGTSVNPARSLSPAVVLGGEALKQVWVFIVAPLVGGALAAIVFKYLNKTEKKKSK
jgi:aquaporin Z